MPGYAYQGLNWQPLPPIDHGTNTGARQHYKRGQKPCPDCCEAQAAAARKRRARHARAGYREPCRLKNRHIRYEDFGDTLGDLRKLCQTQESEWFTELDGSRHYIMKRDDVMRKLHLEGHTFRVLMEVTGLSKAATSAAIKRARLRESKRT